MLPSPFTPLPVSIAIHLQTITEDKIFHTWEDRNFNLGKFRFPEDFGLSYRNKTSVKLQSFIIKIKCFAVKLEMKCVLVDFNHPWDIGIFFVLFIPKDKKGHWTINRHMTSHFKDSYKDV